MARALDPRAALAGGDSRSLGRTEEVVAAVLADHALLDPLFDSLLDEDELVRMRAADGLEKVCRERPEWLVPYVDRLLTQVAAVEQDSVRWHVAQILGEVHLSEEQRADAIGLLERFADEERAGFVVAHALTGLAALAADDPALRPRLLARLRRLTDDDRRSVATRARKLLAGLE